MKLLCIHNRAVSFRSSATFDDVTTGRALIQHSIERCALGREIDTHSYGAPFSHLFTELKISPIEVHISAIQLQISPIHLKISSNQLEISTIKPI